MMGRYSMGSQLTGDRVKKMNKGGKNAKGDIDTPARKAQQRRLDQMMEDEAEIKGGTKLDRAFEREAQTKKALSDLENLDRYGADAQKGRSFGQKKAYGGKMKKMGAGGKMSRGDGICTKGKTKGRMV